uniref:HTH_48 domain-containing protein n=1 Tax=Rhodnius prolixus TaxID=13249 RepID=T1HI66_RHOPR
MERTLEQRYAIKFCIKLQKTAKETFDLLTQAFKDDCLSYSKVKKWHKSFKEGREEVADEARSGRPSTSRTDDKVTRVRDLLNKDRRMSVRLMSEQLNLPKTDVHRIVSEDLAM